MVQSIDEAELQDAIREVSDGTDAIAVSGFFSVCNGWQEINVKDAIVKAVDKPVIMGQMFTSDLGIFERTNTAVLNAKLLTVIDDFPQQRGKVAAGEGHRGTHLCLQGRRRPDEHVDGQGKAGGNGHIRAGGQPDGREDTGHAGTTP